MQLNGQESPESLAARLMGAQKRAQALESERNRNEAHLGVAKARLAELQDEARQQFGTDSPDALREIAAKITRESEQAVTQFERQIAEIEAALQEMTP